MHKPGVKITLDPLAFLYVFQEGGQGMRRPPSTSHWLLGLYATRVA